MAQQADYCYVLELTAAALRERAQAVLSSGAPYDQGRLEGYYEALAEIVNQAQVVGIDLADIGLDGFIPESLLKPRKAA